MRSNSIAAKYLRQAQGRSAARYFGGEDHHNFVDDFQGFVSQPMMNATGSAAVKPSLPYSIQISSASAVAVAAFDVFGASTYLNNPNVTFNANGDLVIGSITISSTTPGVTYRDLLQQSGWQPFTIGQTYVSCPNSSAQILVPYTITAKDASGVLVALPGKPKKDPYQQQTDVLVDSTVYSIDGLSKITFNQILPLAVLSLDFYPQANVNAGRQLNGQPLGKDYGNPGIIRSNLAVIPNGGASNFSGGTMVRTRY